MLSVQPIVGTVYWDLIAFEIQSTHLEEERASCALLSDPHSALCLKSFFTRSSHFISCFDCISFCGSTTSSRFSSSTFFYNLFTCTPFSFTAVPSSTFTSRSILCSRSNIIENMIYYSLRSFHSLSTKSSPSPPMLVTLSGDNSFLVILTSSILS